MRLILLQKRKNHDDLKVLLIKPVRHVTCGKHLRVIQNVLAVIYAKKTDKNVTVTFYTNIKIPIKITAELF